MGFMASAANILNNTILIPTGGNLTDLPKNTVGTEINAYNQAYNDRKVAYDSGNPQTVYLKVKGENASKMVMVQSSANFGMSREYTQQRCGGNSEYVVNLPGNVKYSDVMFSFVFMRDTYFLDWLTNGHLVNGVTRADIEIHVGAKNKDTNERMILTLRDAFPISWHLNYVKLYKKAEDNQVLLEFVTFSYSSVDFSVQSVE